MADGSATHDATKIDHHARTRAINRAILEEEKRLRARHPWLARQDALGLAIFLGSVVVTAGAGAAYVFGAIPWWVAVPVMGFALSLLHELEHDLIHGIYFRNRPRVVDALFAVIWVFKQNLNPWTRRVLHLLHHRRSGQRDDVEERLIGLGLPFGPRRVLSWFPFGSALFLPWILWDVFRARRQDASLTLPLPDVWGLLRLAMDGVFVFAPIVLGVLALRGSDVAATAFVVVAAPQLLRHAAIAIVSSYSHYWEVAENDVYEQNQVLDHPVTWPLQAFCFNFGSTHVLHHYVVPQPFYLRQWVARAAHAELRRQGVPFNDFAAFARRNTRAPAA